MKIRETVLKDAFVIEPKVFEDKRGFFYEGLNKKEVEGLRGQKWHFDILQLNFSKSSYGVLRGLHFQKPPFDQAKLVSVTRGEAWDVIVDVRRKSDTFGKWHGELLSETNKTRFFVPKGFAHGFVCLTEEVELMYAVDNYYHKESECGIRYDDPHLNIDWKLTADRIILSDRDRELDSFQSIH